MSLAPQQWVMVTVVHTRGRFMRKSEFTFYVDGFQRQTVHLKYPSTSEVRTVREFACNADKSEVMVSGALSGAV